MRRRLIFESSSILIFLLIFIFSTYFSRPVFSRRTAPIFTGTISVWRPHILEISISNFLYFESFLIVLTDDDDVDDDDEDDYYYVLLSSSYCSELRGATSFLGSGWEEEKVAIISLVESTFLKMWLILWRSSILMFPGILLTYFPRPFVSRLSASYYFCCRGWKDNQEWIKTVKVVLK